MEDNLQWKTTFNGWRPLMEDDLRWKITFNGIRPSMEDNLWWKTCFNQRWPSTEDDLWWKTTFDRRQPSIEEDLHWKTPFDGREILRFCSAIYRRCGNFCTCMTLYGFCMFILGFGWELWVIDLLLTSMVVCLNWVWALLDVDADCYSIFYISCNKFLYRRSNYMIQNALYGPLCSHLYILVRSNTFLQVLAWHSVFTWNFVKKFCW